MDEEKPTAVSTINAAVKSKQVKRAIKLKTPALHSQPLYTANNPTNRQQFSAHIHRSEKAAC